MRPWAQQTPSHWRKGHLCTIPPFGPSHCCPSGHLPFPVSVLCRWSHSAGNDLKRREVASGRHGFQCRLEPCWVPAMLPPAGPTQGDREEHQGIALELGERQQHDWQEVLKPSPDMILNEVFKPCTVQLHVHFTTFSFSAYNNHMSLPRWVTFLLFYKWENWGFSDTARKGPTLDGNPDVVATSQWDVLILAQRMRRASPSPESYLLTSSKTIKGLSFKSLTLIYGLKWLSIYYKFGTSAFKGLEKSSSLTPN